MRLPISILWYFLYSFVLYTYLLNKDNLLLKAKYMERLLKKIYIVNSLETAC